MLNLHPHQQKAVDELDNGKILYGGVGTGKSRTAVAYYLRSETPRDVYVITTAKKRDSFDWEGEFLAAKVYRKDSGNETGADDIRRDHGVLTVDSWNNIEKYKDVENAFFIFDEQRLVGSGLWSRSFIKIAKKNRWILLTATPGDTWLDYIPVFVANGFYKNRTEFKQRHVVYNNYAKFPKVERYIQTGELIKHRNSILVVMPYLRHTVRQQHDVEVAYDQELFNKVWNDRWHVYEQRPLRDVAEMCAVARKVVNSDPSRLEAVRAALKKHPKLIVFYSFNYELEILRNGLAEEVPLAEWNGHYHQPIPDESRWVYLVQYVAGSEGWNCIETDAEFFYSLTYSYKNWEQAHGRIDRLNTPFTELNYYVPRSGSLIDKMIWKSLSNKESFQESKLGVTF